MNEMQFIETEPEITNLQPPSQPSLLNQGDFPSQSVLARLQAPPQQRELKPDALEHDIRLGWIPRSQITGPVPLSFSSQMSDEIIEQKMQKMIYLGYRPSTTFDLHSQFYGEGKNYPFHQFHLCKAKFLERFFKKYYSQYTFQARQPSQINHSQLIFDSYFEGGNLDAVYFEQNEYRLLIRVDSNTVGHCNFYNFKVKALQAGKVVFRIMNITKWKSLYQRGLKPYVKKINKDGSSQFLQSGQHISFGQSPLNQEFQSTRLKSLKFQFNFPQADCEYQFCYSIPYTYSDLLQDLKRNKQKCFHLGKLCHSLSGVQVPLVTIAAPQKQDKNQTWVIVVIGRVHPSQATGSHIVNGLIKNLISQSKQFSELRQKVIFKIIPMLNPDGVILGNTRTGVAGKDLNRQYKKNADFVFPEIIAIMDYIKKLKEKYNNKLLYVIDIHGHSSRKNSFFYGPEFSIIDEEYSKCRLLPRLYAARTDIFRYHSCKYKVASTKEATARGYFNVLGIRTYTHQTSAHCFFDFVTRKDKAFTRASLQELGKQLLLSIYDYMKLISKTRVDNFKMQEEVLPKIKQKKVEKIEVEEQDSDKMSSNKDDSQDEKEDFQEKQVVQFFRKINQNKEYFYEQLLLSQGIEPKQKNRVPPIIKQKQERKIKKSESQKIEPIKQAVQPRPKAEDSVIKRNSERKIDWINKLTYPQKKKSFQEYPKLSSVIFGSTIPQNLFQRLEKTQSVSKPSQEFQAGFGNTTKYSINCIEAQFKSTVTKYPWPEPKVFKSHSYLKKQSKQKQRDSLEAQPLKQMDKKAKQRYLQLKQELLPSLEQKNISIQRNFEYQSFKPLPVCAVQIPKNPIYPINEQKQAEKRSLSLKILPRKKSIRNIRESETVQTKKISKNMKFSSLTKNLPLIGSLYFNN